MNIPSRKALKKTPVYVPGMRIDEVIQKYHLKDVIKLSSNENALGPPKSAIAAARKVLANMHRYPDPSSDSLKRAIAAKDRISMDHILISHGLEEMIPALCRAYINPGDESVQPSLTFIKYEIGAAIMDGTTIKVPMEDLECNLDGMINAITDKTKIIWLCNPNNPTGTYTSRKNLIRFMEAVPPSVLVVHDETYRGFVSAQDYPMDSAQFLDYYPNFIIMRSFSKSFGLAGFRCGYMLAAPDIVRNVFKVREIFCVDSLSSAAAEAALTDDTYLEHVQEVIGQGRIYLENRLLELPSDIVRFKRSQANFVYLETPYDNKFLFEEILKQGVIVRPIGEKGLRITVGLHNENVAFMRAFRIALQHCYRKSLGSHHGAIA